jgi:hypothetical protein
MEGEVKDTACLRGVSERECLRRLRKGGIGMFWGWNMAEWLGGTEKGLGHVECRDRRLHNFVSIETAGCRLQACRSAGT